ncbi:S1C family serine protease [Nocardioides sp. CFH 31398]|uniref:S1C family serine protease n=1 Tax=Nocardioides sp. CFH 31398 TaxID=2919579 RepID=UPI001F06F9CC|nr:trypsin-like peptidase domain-containing protein [Nocardioides sp. CFH 31398]MCH1868002.1 trypsin-like peptidase domain-containing protein [Nocardioides sp. CFH 31398]
MSDQQRPPQPQQPGQQPGQGWQPQQPQQYGGQQPGQYAGRRVQQTARYPQQGYPPQQAPQQQAPQQWGAPPAQPPSGHRPDSGRSSGRGKGLGAGLLAGALVLGLLGGVGGAAAWDNIKPGNEVDDIVSGGTVDTDEVDLSGVNPVDIVTVNQVSSEVLPTVVKIDARDGEGGGGSGSGIILTSDGEILTNDHVIASANTEGGSLTISFDDGTLAPATIIGTDPATDTALIKAEGMSDLPVIDVGSSDATEVGQAVVAVGSPYGLQSTVTAGIVSALRRPIVIPSVEDPDQNSVYGAIQTDAAINPGNSGGALVNMGGELIGINSSIELARSSEGSGDLGSIGIGYAIPVDDVKDIVEEMRNGETPTHARLGVATNDELTEEDVPSGALVSEVESGQAAEEAGIEEGDVITRLGDIPVISSNGLIAAVYAFRPGETADVVVDRDGEQQTLSVTFGSDAE